MIIYSFIQLYLLSTYLGPGNSSDTGDAAINKTKPFFNKNFVKFVMSTDPQVMSHVGF